MRRRAVVMLVSRLREEIARERSSRAESKAAKKRGGGGTTATPAAAAGAAEEPAAKAEPLSTAAEEREALWDVMRRSNSSVWGCSADGASAAEQQASLPHGMEAFRDAVFRLGGEDDVGIFRSVVGFL